jgi:hypothetical protein
VALVPFSAVDISALRWVRTLEAPVAFSLRSEDQELATLAWERAEGSLATGTTAEASWTFKRAGFLQPTILAREPGHDEPIARLTAHLARHEITIGAGPSYRLRHVSHLVPAWRLTTDRGEELLHVEPVAEGRKLQGGAVVVAPGTAVPSIALLIVISWYFVVLTWFEDEAIDALTPFEGPYPPLARSRGSETA